MVPDEDRGVVRASPQMVRVLSVLLVVSLAGCSWLFQEHLPSEYSGQSEPVCSTSKGLPTLDAILATLEVAGTIGLATDSSDSTDKSAYIVGGVIDTIIFGASALTGNGWANDCRDARRQWDDSESEQAQADRRKEMERLRREVDRQRKRAGGDDTAGDGDGEQQREPRREAQTPPPPPRGFYCTVSDETDGGACMREKADCQLVHDAAPGMSDCKLVETAWCFNDKRCTPDEDACNAQREKAATAGGQVGGCADRKSPVTRRAARRVPTYPFNCFSFAGAVSGANAPATNVIRRFTVVM